MIGLMTAVLSLSAAALAPVEAQDAASDPASAPASDPWAEAARPFTQEGNALAGPGADWLSAEISEAQHVLVGEQHGVDGLARLTAALEAEFQPDVLVLEAGPWIGQRISEDGVGEALAFAPYSLAFDFNGDIALIEQFQARTSAAGAAGAVWGIDQEANAIHPYAWLAKNADRGSTRRVARGLHLKAALDAGEYLRNDHHADLNALWRTTDSSDLQMQQIADDTLRRSMEIFVTWRSGARGQASAHREQYMFNRHDAERAAFEASAGRQPRLLFKMGGAHIMEGETGPNGIMTLGEHVQRRADADDVTALHLGVRGYNPETTPYPIADLIEAQSLLLLDTQILRQAIEDGTITGLADDQIADIYGFEALIYINPLQRASQSEIQVLQSAFRSALLTSLGLHFWPAPLVLILTLVGVGGLAARGMGRRGPVTGPALTLIVASAATLTLFGLQILALVSTAPGAAAPSPAFLAYLAPLLAMTALADTGWRGRTGPRARWIMGLIWAGLLLWLAIAMHRWNFGAMLG